MENSIAGRLERSFRSRSIWFVARILVALTILGYLSSRLDWRELYRMASQVHLVWISIAAALLGVTFIIGGVRLWLLLKTQKVGARISDTVKLTFIGQFFSTFLLGTVGGDVVKIAYVMKYSHNNKGGAALAVLIDRGIGLVILLCIAALAFPWRWYELTSQNDTRAMVFWVSVTLLLLCTAVVLFLLHALLLKSIAAYRRKVVSLTQVPPLRLIAKTTSGLLKCWQETLWAVACSIAIYLFVFGAGYCLTRAMDLDTQIVDVVLILSIVIVVTSLPISVGGHGVREVTFIVLFDLLEVTSLGSIHGAEVAILFSIAYFSLFLFWSVFGGGLYIGMRRRNLEHVRRKNYV